MTTETVFTITPKSRNLSLNHTNKPTGHGTEISTPNAPKQQGGLATVKRELAFCRKINSGGTYYNTALFVHGKRVVEVYHSMSETWIPWQGYGLETFLNEIEWGGEVTVFTEGDDNE